MNEKFSLPEFNKSLDGLVFSGVELRTIEALGLTVDDIKKLVSAEPIAEGSYALIFDVPTNDRDIIAKVWKNPKEDSLRADHENVALRLLRFHKARNVPRLIGYLPTSTIIFEDKINGTPIENYDTNAIKQLANALTSLHSIKLNSYGKPLTKRKKGTFGDCYDDGLNNLRLRAQNLNEQNDLDQVVAQAINKLSHETENKQEAFSGSEFTLVHFDLNMNNILRSNINDELVIIDWEQASAGDAAMDVAKCFLKLQFDEWQQEVFLREYKKDVFSDNYFKNRLLAYEPFVLVNSILWRLSVLKYYSDQLSIQNNDEFFIRVQKNLVKELEVLKKYVSNN